MNPSRIALNHLAMLNRSLLTADRRGAVSAGFADEFR